MFLLLDIFVSFFLLIGVIELICEHYSVIDESDNFISNCNNCNYMLNPCDKCIAGISENCLCEYYKVSICYNCVGLILSNMNREMVFQDNSDLIYTLSKTQEWRNLKKLIVQFIENDVRLIEMFHEELYE